MHWIVTILISLFVTQPNEKAALDLNAYDSLKGESLPDRALFERSWLGFQALTTGDQVVRRDFLAIIDYRLPSTAKRLWVIDTREMKVVMHSYVAHGKNSGENFANRFSNTHESLQSSLGFFVTGEEYRGKHGRSLKLIGLEKGINDQASSRAIVIHGADYVSEHYIRNYGRLGRSFGCPAVPLELHDKLITLLGTGSCLFIYYPDAQYLSVSGLGC